MTRPIVTLTRSVELNRLTDWRLLLHVDLEGLLLHVWPAASDNKWPHIFGLARSVRPEDHIKQLSNS